MAGRRARAARPQRRPDPEPMEVDESLVIAIGTGLWLLAWTVLFIAHDELEARGNEWYLWTAAAGLALGVWGWLLVRKRVEARLAARLRPTEATLPAPVPTPEPIPEPIPELTFEATPEPTPELTSEPTPVPPQPARGTGRRRRAAN